MGHSKKYRRCKVSLRDTPWSLLLGSLQFRGSMAYLLAWYHGIVRLACLVWGLPMLFLSFLYKVRQSLYTVSQRNWESVKQDVLHNFAKKHLFCLCSISVLMLSSNCFSDIFSSFNIFFRSTYCFWYIFVSWNFCT